LKRKSNLTETKTVISFLVWVLAGVYGLALFVTQPWAGLLGLGIGLFAGYITRREGTDDDPPDRERPTGRYYS